MANKPLIEIHGEDPAGRKYVLNRFSGENAEVAGATPDEGETAFERLKRYASAMIPRWRGVFPYDRIFVKEIKSKW